MHGPGNDVNPPVLNRSRLLFRERLL